MSKRDRETSIMGRPWPTGAVRHGGGEICVYYVRICWFNYKNMNSYTTSLMSIEEKYS